MYESRLDWNDAKKFCEDRGGYLATITSAEEQIAVSAMTNGKNAWLGGNYVDGSWKWVTGEAFNYTNWLSGEPNGGANEPYLSMWPAYWNDCSSYPDEFPIISFVMEIDCTNIDKAHTATLTYNNHTYEYYNINVPWSQAKNYCDTRGGYLVTITSAQEQAAVESLVNGNKVWLGATDADSEGTFKWVSGEPFNYTNWSDGQPDNNADAENYVYTWPQKWNDGSEIANDVSGFVLEINHAKLESTYAGSVAYNNHTYELYKAKVPWTTAKAFCESKGGYLATITTSKEQSIVESLTSGNNAWLGGDFLDGSWKWVTGEDFSYTNWLSGEPNGGLIEPYLSMWPAYWNDCTVAPQEYPIISFVLEKEGTYECGDVNQDGSVDLKDLLHMKRYLTNSISTSETLDINHDHSVNSVDLVSFRQFFLGMTTYFSNTCEASVTSDSVRIRSVPSTAYYSTILASVSYVDIIIKGAVMGADGYVWYYITYDDSNGNVTTGYMRSDNISSHHTGEIDLFEESLEAFPESYHTYLRQLHEIYPYWNFTPDYLTMPFEEAVDNESLGFRKEVHVTSQSISWRSMGEEYYNWSTNSWYTDNSSEWTGASWEVIAYYMDPRNFLNTDYVYMFLQQSYDATTQTADGVAELVEGTYLANGYSDPNDTAYGGSYVNVIMEAARQSNVSPYTLAATLILEQGVNGTSDLISGKPYFEGDSNSYYNFFNFSAAGDDVIANGLAYAKSQGWTTRSASIIGGAIKYASGYISNGQDTYYYKDYNVASSSPYTHQYAQAVHSPASTALRVKSAYVDSYDAPLNFRIPVFASIREEVYEKPAQNSLLNNYYFTNISVSGLSPAFDMYTENYSLSVSGNTTITVSMPSGASLASATSYSIPAGTSTITLTVKSQTGYTNDYKIKVTASKACTITVAVS